MLGDISVLDKVYIVCGRTDMRKQIDGLCVIIEEQLKMNTNDNCLFLVTDLMSCPGLAHMNCHRIA